MLPETSDAIYKCNSSLFPDASLSSMSHPVYADLFTLIRIRCIVLRDQLTKVYIFDFLSYIELTFQVECFTKIIPPMFKYRFCHSAT